MATHVMEMATDADITRTNTSPQWRVASRNRWNQLCNGGLDIAGGSTIIVIAHGHGTEIGNANAGTVDINATTFLAIIQSNMEDGAVPAKIYISTCGTGIAEFAANVRIAAEQNHIWSGTEIYGHYDAVSGSVPPASNICWVQIF